MSLQIIKTGLLDTIQDGGRRGYAHLGIGEGGAMDRFSASLANALLGKDLGSPVMEFHFPAGQILFEKETIFCLTGADFTPALNGIALPLNHPVAVPAGTILTFYKMKWGARCYLSSLPLIHLIPWMNSYSTHLKAAAGGFGGRALQKGDRLFYAEEKALNVGSIQLLPWQANGIEQPVRQAVEYLVGSEWNWLKEASKQRFVESYFQVSAAADRMGYRLDGPSLETIESKRSLLSSGVSFGTVQLLPNGQLIVLMADHQTTGGYPRIAHVISAHLPLLAQKHAGEVWQFIASDQESAEQKWMAQQQYLHQLQTACTFKMQRFLDGHRS